MKITLQSLKDKGGVFAITNFMAMKALDHSINSACAAVHHQPKVPDLAKKYRKF